MYKEERKQETIFLENLTEQLRRKGWTKNQLAKAVGVSATAVTKWYKGEAFPKNSTIDVICRALNVQRGDLLADKTEIPNLSIPAAHPVPILGTICAGNGIDAEESFDGYFFVDNSIRADYCLHIEGDSMKDAGINHGDIAFIRKAYDFLNGGIYAVVYGDNNNAVLKKVYRQDDRILLMPCNQLYEPISVNDCRIVGECIGIYSPRYNTHP